MGFTATEKRCLEFSGKSQERLASFEQTTFRGGGGGVLNKVLYGEALPRVPDPYPFIYHFCQKRYPFRIPLVENCTPFIYMLRREFF